MGAVTFEQISSFTKYPLLQGGRVQDDTVTLGEDRLDKCYLVDPEKVPLAAKMIFFPLAPPSNDGVLNSFS